MTWTLTATGHADTPDGEATSNRVEQELLAELRAVLAKPQYGARAALLRGVHVMDTAVHRPVDVEAEPDAEPTQREATGGKRTQTATRHKPAPAAAAAGT